MTLSWEQALAWRMRRHYLPERAAPRDLAAVVDRLCTRAPIAAEAERLAAFLGGDLKLTIKR